MIAKSILKAYKCGTAKFTGLGYQKTGHIPEAIQTHTITLETSQLSPKSPYSQIQEGMKGAEMQVLASELQAPEAPVAPPTIDWDLDSGWARIFEEVKEAKRQRHDDLLLIERERRHLELEKLEFKAKQDAFALHVKQQEEKRLVAFMLWAAKKACCLNEYQL
jgi:hypothetical protein